MDVSSVMKKKREKVEAVMQLGRFAGSLSSSIMKSLSVEKLLASACLGNPILHQATQEKLQ